MRLQGPRALRVGTGDLARLDDHRDEQALQRPVTAGRDNEWFDGVFLGRRRRHAGYSGAAWFHGLDSRLRLV